MKTLLAILLITFNLVIIQQSTVDEQIEPLANRLSVIVGHSPEEAIARTFGEVTLEFVETDYPGYSCWGWDIPIRCYGSVNPLVDERADGLLIHELGHVFLSRLNLSYDDIDMNIGYYENGSYVHVTGFNPETGKFERTTRGYKSPNRPDIQHGELSPDFNCYSEDFADMFMNWARGSFADDTAGKLRFEWMEEFVKSNLPYFRKDSLIYIRSQVMSK